MSSERLKDILREVYDKGAEDHRNQTTEDPSEYLDRVVLDVLKVSFDVWGS